MLIQQFFLGGIAHSSYLMGGSGACAIVDPQRDIEIYLEAAAELGLKITHILETHLHADFISGHLDLAEKTGAKIYAPKSANCKFDHIALKEGDTIQLEDMRLEILETPGHTPEHISYVVIDQARSDEPAAVFCGDTLFVGDVGRPDLFPGMANELASQLFDSLHQKLLKLPDFCEVYPAHGAGSLCGRAMGAKRSSTIGYEKRFNAALQFSERSAFIESLTTDMPAAPDHFSRCSDINAVGPALIKNLSTPMPLEPSEFQQEVNRENSIVVDVRGYDAFGGQHVPGAFHLDLNGNFATFAGWILPPEKDILLVTDNPTQIENAVVQMHRVGLDRIKASLAGGMPAWCRAGLTTAHVAQFSASEFYEMSQQEPVVLVDVRAQTEFSAQNIAGAHNIPVHQLRTDASEIPSDKPVILLCSSGNRSSLGASLLLQRRFKTVYNLAGGITGYSAAGYAKECPMCHSPHGPRFLGTK